jgi:hypothetical protein
MVGLALGWRGPDFKLEISNLKDGQKWEFEQQKFNRGLRGLDGGPIN